MAFEQMIGIGARDDTGKAFASVNNNIKRTADNAKKLDGSLRMMRGGMGQLGHQIQDVAVQLQMGQNALMVFTQQGSQVASLFGPTGAIIGALGAVAGALAAAFVPRLMDSKDRTEELNKAVSDLSSLMREDGKTGLTVYAGELAKVASISQAAGDHLRLKAFLVADERLKAVNEEIQSTTKNFDQLRLTAARGMAPAKRQDASFFGLEPQQFAKVKEQLEGVDLASFESRESVAQFLTQMLSVQKTLKGDVDPEFEKLVDNFVASHTELATLNDQAERLRTAGLAEPGKDAASAFDKFAESLKKTVQQAEGLTPAQLFGIQLQNMEGLTDAQRELGAELVRRLRATELAAQKAKDLAQADRDAAAAAREASKDFRFLMSISNIIGNFNEALDADLAKIKENNQAKLEAMRQSFMSEKELLGVQEAEKREFINSLADTYFNEEFTRQDALTQLEKQFSDKRTKIAEDEAEKKRQIQQAGMDVIKGSLDFMASNLQEGTALQKTAFLATKAFAASEAIVAAELAAAKVLAHDAGILGLGALASSNLIRGAGYASAAMIMAQAVASFEGGGFTGRGARSGGLDGKGGFMAMLHPNETVTDHTKGGSGITIINNVDARGSGADVDVKIQAAMQITSQKTVMAVQDLMQRRRL